jgi:lipopolysaccharide exporter
MLTGMWLVADNGVVWVAVVHLAVAAVFTLVRQIVVNRIVEAKASAVLASLGPGAIVGASVLAFALPVRLLSEPGFVSMLGIVAAGALGGVVGLALSRQARSEVQDLVAKLRG